MTVRTLRFLLRKEFRQIFRDRAILAQIVMLPLIQLLVLSNAATFEVRSARMYVVDDDRTGASRGLATRLAASGRFVPVGASASMGRADEAMLHGKADMILRIPAGFESDLVRTRRAPVQLVLNAEDGAAAGVAQSYAVQVLAAYSAELGAEVSAAPLDVVGAAEPPPVRGQPNLEVRRRGWYNAELEYRDYMVPGILVALVTIVGTLMTAVNIVREKEAGTLDQLNVTPVTRSTFIAAKLIPLWSLALGELALGLTVARFLFDVPMRGSVPLVFACAAVYLVAALGIGLWVSTLTETQQQATFVTYFIMLVYLLMSGLFTPYRSMPVWAQWLAQLNPVLHFTQVMRGILLKGAGVGEVLRPMGILAVYGAVVLTLAVRQYAKRAA